MATKKLAKELGLLRQRSKSSNGLKKSLVSNQSFSYLIVIDFESTCWREKNNYSQEIIEFPAVLLNTSTGEVESEFHSYVQPQEHPLLSEFCTELTGITQIQVEAGIPLHICLSRFSRWLQNLQLEKGVVFPNNQQRSSVPAASQKLCTFVTWSDWDLGVCLQYECKRKQLHKPDVLNSWIDLRSTYKLFYDRKPKGLNGALQDLGIQFAGREHSGLDDARNTAQLAARMMRDGCVMKITRSLVKAPAMVKPTFGNTAPADNKKLQSNTYQEENKPSSSRIPPKGCQIKSCSDNVTNHLNTKESSSLVQESVQICQSLISPKTLLNGTTTPQWGRNRRSVSAEAVTNIPSSIMVNSPSSHSSNTSLVLCSTTVSCLSSLPQINQPFTSAAGLKHGEEEEGAELSVEIEDRCGSYDDVVLEGAGDDEEAERHLEVNYVSDFDTGCGMWEQLDNTHSPYAQVDNRETVSVQSNFKTPNVTRKQSTMSLSVNVSNQNGIRQNSTILEPKTVTLENKSNQQEAEFKTPLQVQAKSDSLKKRTITNAPLPFRQSCFIPEKTSTPNIAFARPRAFITQKHKENTKSSFTIFTDPGKPSTSSTYVSFCTPKNVLTSLSTNTTSSITKRSSVSMTTKRQGSITSPLCGCGRRAKRQVVSNGGPNQGRGFFCCPVRRSGSGGRIQKGCEFFKWESAVRRSSSVVSPALRSSVSLCQSNSTISCRPPQRSMIR